MTWSHIFLFLSMFMSCTEMTGFKHFFSWDTPCSHYVLKFSHSGYQYRCFSKPDAKSPSGMAYLWDMGKAFFQVATLAEILFKISLFPPPPFPTSIFFAVLALAGDYILWLRPANWGGFETSAIDGFLVLAGHYYCRTWPMKAVYLNV